MRHYLVAALMMGLPIPAISQDSAPQEIPAPQHMTVTRLGEIAARLDREMVTDGSRFQITIDDIPVLIVTDAAADRMRVMVPIRSAAGLEPEELMRLLQANFDSALDARYAVAQGKLWGVFIHPLRALEPQELI